MSRAVTLALVATALAGLAACHGQVETHAVMLRAPVPPTGNRVEVYMTGQSPPRRFYEMGFVQAIGFADTANPEDLVRGLVQRGGEAGCEAIVRVQVDVGYTKGHATGVCVRWLEPLAPGAPSYVPPPVPPGAPRPPPPVRPTPAPRPIDPSPSSVNPGLGL